METAYHIFKDHPNWQNLNFVVEPLIREKIMIGSDMPVFNSMKTITEEYLPLFPNLDLSKLEPLCQELSEPWYFKTLNADFRSKFYDEYSMLNTMEDTFPQHQESVWNAKERADKFKHQIFEIVQVDPNEKIAVVSHSMFMKILTSKDEFWTNHFDPAD
jgi:hypothetical protein